MGEGGLYTVWQAVAGGVGSRVSELKVRVGLYGLGFRVAYHIVLEHTVDGQNPALL